MGTFNSKQLVAIAGRAMLGGLGLGTAFYSATFIYLSWQEGQSINPVDVVALVAGVMCVVMAIRGVKRKPNS